MRIRTAIFGVYVVASAAGFLAMLALVLRDVRLRYVESMQATMEDSAAYIAAMVAPSVSAEDWKGRLTVLPRPAELLRVYACDPDGRVLFDSAGRDEGMFYPRPPRGGKPPAELDPRHEEPHFVQGELRVEAPIERGGATIGWIGVGRPMKTLAQAVRAARWRLAAYSSGIALVMVVAGWWIAARLTRSLERLTDHVRAVRDRRSSVPPISRAREISELGTAFEEMREALEGRQHVERYTQALAHEVKAPLAAIQGAAELLNEEMPEEQRAKFLGNIRVGSARIQRIIERLLELSSLEARKQLRQTERVPAARLAAEAADLVRPAADGRGIRITVNAHDGIAIHGELVLLREALVNLLQNAVEFSAAGGEVMLTVKPDAGRVCFAVEDRGPGVPAFALGRVFERFYSLPRPGTVQKSTGLGLALVREIAHLHGGDAMLENRADGGARAVFWMPKV